MKKIVMKFGGRSVATGDNIKHVAKIVADATKKDCRVVVVVSTLDGVTDELFEAANQAQKAKQEYTQKFKQSVLERHKSASAKAIKTKEIAREAQQTIENIIDELEKVLTGISYVGELTPKSRDFVLSFGGRLSAPIVCGAIRDLKLQSQWFTGKDAGIVTDSNFGQADPLMNVTSHQSACLQCHAKAGGGDNTKRGDLALAHANTADRSFDVHMATTGANFACTGFGFAGTGQVEWAPLLVELKEQFAPAQCRDRVRRARARQL